MLSSVDESDIEVWIVLWIVLIREESLTFFRSGLSIVNH
jgi:hypothetical protein